jgi:hypothetical protein
MRSQAQSLWVQGNADNIGVPDQPTKFELRLNVLGLAGSPDKWASSQKLRRWVKGHKNKCYVPEELIRDMGLAGFYEGE